MFFGNLTAPFIEILPTNLALNGSETPYVGYTEAGNSTKAMVMKLESSQEAIENLIGIVVSMKLKCGIPERQKAH